MFTGLDFRPLIVLSIIGIICGIWKIIDIVVWIIAHITINISF